MAGPLAAKGLPAGQLTEMTEIDADRIDGVANPANGIPILMMKSINPTPAAKAVNAVGGIDEKPDIAGAEHVLQLLAQLIQSEAAEMAAGHFNESCDIALLNEAVSLMRCFRDMESYGDEDDGEGLGKSAGITDEDVRTFLAKRKVSAAERKRLASEGKALSDGSYPIENAEDLKNAAILARSGHGDVAAAKRLIAKRAKELGVANPLASDGAQKGAEETPAATEPQVQDPATPDGEDQVQKAVAAAMESHEAAIKELRDELAKLKATPLPGGPAFTAPASVRSDQERDEKVQKAAHYRRLADQVNDRELRKYYEGLAKQAEESAR